MPKQITDLREFVELVMNEKSGVKKVTVKKNVDNTKFKLRTPKVLYTLVVEDNERAQKLIQSLSPNLEIVHIEKTRPNAKSDE